MRVVKPGWVTHNDGNPIFSVDIHPDGSRCVTGGQGADYGKIIIWNMAPIRDESLENDDSVPKILCQMDNHFACVNCVRWSHSGKFLASGGDDKLIMIWQTSRGAGPSKAFGSSGSVMNYEQWRPVFTLRGHSGDVLDLNWSPQDVWLATCSVDNTVVIWNALKFPEQIRTLKGHTGLVKGVTWDPVGKYIASQSDDRTLRVWRTMDWQPEVVIDEPFKECSGTTHLLRLNWSPDGHHIVSAHAMNNKGPTAQIIERQGFKASLDFVGHRKAITVVRFNPNIFSKKFKGDKAHQYSCCAIGSKDRSLSIWLTALKRPLVVMHDLFENSILDLTWSQNGMELMTCSLDGTVAYMDFTKEEIGHPLSQDEVLTLLENMYGKGLSLHTAATKGSQIIEDAAMLNLQQQQKNKEANSAVLTPSKNSNLSSQMSAGGSNTPFKVVDLAVPTDKQIETRTADGRRRITPIFLAPQPEFGEVPLPFSTNSNIEFHTSSEKSKIVVEKQNRVTAPGMLSPSSGSKSLPSPPNSIPAQSSAVKDMFGAKEAQALKSVNEMTPEKGTSKSQQGLVSEQSSTGSEKTPLAEKTEKAVSTPTSEKPKPAEKDKEKEKDSGKDSSAKDKLKSRLTSGNLSLKRKYGDDKRYGKRGRPSKTDQAAREAAMAAAAAEAVGSITTSLLLPSASGAAQGTVPSTQHKETRVISSVADLQLPAMTIDKSESAVIQGQMGDANSLMLEVENGYELGATRVNRLRCTRGAKVMWDHMLTSKISAVAGSNHVLCAACNSGTVSIFSISGRRLLPALVTGGPPAYFSCKGYYVLMVTTKGMLYVWNCQSLKAEICQESLTAIMSEKDKIDKVMISIEGVPVVTLANEKSYSFSTDIGCWIVASNEEERLQACSNHHQCTPSRLPPTGTLSSLQKHSRSSDQASRSFQSNPGAQQSMTLSFLESQVASSLALKSANEHKFWLETYIRYLAQEGLEEKLREVCDELLGPVYKSRNSKSWSSSVLGIEKHKILRSVLPSIGADLRFQRLYTEYKDQLDGMYGM